MTSWFSNQILIFLILSAPLFSSVVSIGFSMKKSLGLGFLSLSYFLSGMLSLVLFLRLHDSYSSIKLLNLVFCVNKFNLLLVVCGNVVNSLLLLNFFKDMKKTDERTSRVFLFLDAMAMCCFTNIAFSKGLVVMTMSYFLMVISIYFSMDNFREKKQDYGVLLRYLRANILPFTFLLLPSVIVLCIKGKTTLFVDGGTLSVSGNELLFGVLLAMFIFGVSMSLPFGFSDWMLEIKEYSKFTSIGIQTIFVNASIIMIGNVINNVFGQENIDLLMKEFFTGRWLMYFFSFHGLFFSIKALKSKEIIQKTSFSTISQTGYTISALLLANGVSFVNVILWMFFHSFAKAGLLMIGHIAYVLYGHDGKKESISVLSKNGLVIPYVGLGFSIAGVPPLAGFFSKYAILIDTLKEGMFIPAAAVFLSAVINVMYIWPGIKGFLDSRESRFKINFFSIKSLPVLYAGPIWACFLITIGASFLMCAKYFTS